MCDKEQGKDLNWLFELRNIGDYGVTVHVSKKDAERAVQAAEKFLQSARLLIKYSKSFDYLSSILMERPSFRK
jgi:uncharacterized protein (UPF0332 family)